MTFTLKCLDKLLFLLGLHTTEHVVFLHGSRHVFVGFQRSGIHVGVGIRHAHFRRNAGNRAWIVAGNHVHGNALLLEKLNGLRRRRTNLIVDANEGQRLGITYQRAVFREARNRRKYQNACVFSQLRDAFFNKRVTLPHDKLTRAHNICGVLKSRARPFFVRRERNRTHQRQHHARLPLAILHNGARRFIGVVLGSHERYQRTGNLLLASARHQLDRIHFHSARGDGARFIQAQHVHASQRFNAVQLLDQHV